MLTDEQIVKNFIESYLMVKLLYRVYDVVFIITLFLDSLQVQES